MKLILEIDDQNTADSKTADVLVSGRIVGSGFNSHIEWGEKDFSAAEQTARLTEVANGIQKLVKEYYSKGRLLLPFISKRGADAHGNIIFAEGQGWALKGGSFPESDLLVKERGETALGADGSNKVD